MLALLGAQLCFASFPVAGKLAFRGFSPLAVAAWRVLFGSAVLLTLARARHGAAVRLPGRELAVAFGLSLLGITINQVLFVQGLKLSTATHAGLLVAVIPVATYGIAVALRRERLVARKALGIASACVGVGVLFVARGGGGGDGQALGDLLLVLNSLSYSGYLVLARPILQRRPALVVVAWVFFFGAVAVAPLALGETWVPRGVGVGPWLALAWILVFPTVIAYLLNLWALARVEATTVAIFVCLQPLLTAVLAWAMLGERLEPASAAMGALVLAGVWCVAGGRKAAA